MEILLLMLVLAPAVWANLGWMLGVAGSGLVLVAGYRVCRLAASTLREAVEAALEVGPAGARVLELESAAGRCPVCAEGLGSQTVQCAQCQTPHHADCWSYVGHCSTYACQARTAF